MDANNKQPQFEKSSFTCPHCNAFAHMSWRELWEETPGEDQQNLESTEFYLCRCISCGRASIWEELAGPNMHVRSGKGTMLHPQAMTAPASHPDLPEQCVRDYSEARMIAQCSPRGAAALLRLCIQKLCAELGQSGANINSDIAKLAKTGLPPQIIQALDIVRVVGNNAVHPGVMTPEDHAEQVNTLFELINLIVEQMISQPKRVNSMFASLPKSALEAIAKRDAKPK